MTEPVERFRRDERRSSRFEVLVLRALWLLLLFSIWGRDSKDVERVQLWRDDALAHLKGPVAGEVEGATKHRENLFPGLR